MRMIKILLLMALIMPGFINGRDLGCGDYQYENSHFSPISTDKFLLDTAESWPRLIGYHVTDELITTFNCFGQFGNYDWPIWATDKQGGNYQSFPTFRTPPDAETDYLFGGAIWVGGIINQDTLVSVGADGWNFDREMYPPYNVNVNRDISYADNSYHTHYTGTMIHDNFEYILNPNALNIQLALRSHNINNDTFNKTILYDLLVTNIGDQTIESAYIGFFMDPDIGLPRSGAGMRSDDLAGSIREHGLAYAYDNDGDPQKPDYDIFSDTSVIRAIGLKLIETSFNAADTNFNWWSSNIIPAYDFGARLKPTPNDPFRDFGTGGTGTPEGDENKYYIMSHKEWDYDMIYAPHITDDDSVWLNTLPNTAEDWTIGTDMRFLLSVGPVDLLPDSSARVVFSLLTPEQFHLDPQSFQDNYSNLEQYFNYLDFESLIQSADNADLLADSLVNPRFPVMGLRQSNKRNDSVWIEWDPWVYDDVFGYEIYLSPVPFEMFPYPDALPPWLEPEDYFLHNRVSRNAKYCLTDLDPNQYYFINVANYIGKTPGEPSKTLIVRAGERYPAPEINDKYVFTPDGEPAIIGWNEPTGIDLDYYNVYRFDTSFVRTKPDHAFYSQNRHDYSYYNLADSFEVNNKLYYYYAHEPYAVVDSGINAFSIDPVDEQYRYFITVVDKNGLESHFSEPVYTYYNIPKTRDVIFAYEYANVVGLLNNDSLLSYYNNILSGYDYEITSISEHTNSLDCHLMNRDECFDWKMILPFRLMILDGGLDELYSVSQYRPHAQWFSKYLASGGTIAYFGNLRNDNDIPDYIYDFGQYPIIGEFTKKYFGIDSLKILPFYSYYELHYPDPLPERDSLGGFIKAVSVEPFFPDLDVDTINNRYQPEAVPFLWPYKTAPGVSSFTVNERGQTLYLYESLYPEWSLFDNEPVGVLTEDEDFTTYLFGFHLWQMEYPDARILIDRIMNNIPTEIDDSDNQVIPDKFNLMQNYPNPFNASTVISYSISTRSYVSLEIFNILGRKVKTLVNEEKPAGVFSIDWDGSDDNNNVVASGIYFYRIKIDENFIAKKMILLK